MDWHDDAIDAAWEAFWGDSHQIEKADMKAALNAACEAQRKKTSEIMNQRLLEKIKELESGHGDI
jgi:hypothetical protein